jgi:hypothetical protein
MRMRDSRGFTLSNQLMFDIVLATATVTPRYPLPRCLYVARRAFNSHPEACPLINFDKPTHALPCAAAIFFVTVCTVYAAPVYLLNALVFFNVSSYPNGYTLQP